MLQALVVTLREGIEAALVVGILLAYLERTGRRELKRYVHVGVAAAALASVAGAVLFQAFGLDPENEIWEGTVQLVAAGLVGTMLVWMWRAGRTMKARLEAELQVVLPGDGSAATRGLGLAVFTFLMVGREGVEAVIFVSALSSTISANPLNNLIGGSAGLLLAAVFAYLLARGSLRVNLGRFFAVTGAVLLLLVAKLIANGVHEFTERGLLPSNPTELRIIGLFTRESMNTLILVLLIGLPGLMVLWEAWRSRAPDRLPGESAVERRTRLARIRSGRRWAAAVAAASLVICSGLLISAAAASQEGYDPAPIRLAPMDGMVRVPLQGLADGRIHKYVVDTGGVDVRFFLLSRPDRSLASAFDACGICPPVGYLQERDQLLCHNCDAPINLNSVGRPGGCNPVPLASTVKDGAVVVRVSDLAAGSARFAVG